MRDELRPGEVLDERYRLERRLGEGGMGTVWVAHQIALERDVAVKVLHAASDEVRPRLRREALALAAVHHPAVVQVFDYGEMRAGVPFVVMELVRGESLAVRRARGGSFTAEEAVSLVLPLLEGLAAAHQAGVVHRDVKPENVLLADGPAGVAPKLCDFGIARIVRAGAALSTDGGVVGTPAYMAPEQVQGRAVDARTDVWGAGVLLYELVAGARPFGDDDVFAVMHRVMSDPPPYPRHARGLDGRLWSILMGALRKTPEERTPSALALHDQLSAWLAARGGAARIVGAQTRSPVSVELTPTLPAQPEPAPAPRDDAPPSIDALIRAKLDG
ncbi:MAG: serine/threonine-protein kinase [Minicystis sp.]